MKSSFCIDLQRFMLIPTKFPLSPIMSQGLTRIAIRAECQGKAFQAIISLLFPTEGYAALAPGYLHRQADVYCLPGKFSPLQYYLAFPIFPHDISTEPVLHLRREVYKQKKSCNLRRDHRKHPCGR